MKLSIVMPARNEASVVERTVRELHGELVKGAIDHEIVVVDDGSTDATRSLVETLVSDIPELRPATNGPPHGFGLAAREGLRLATGEVVAVVMADGSDPAEDVARFFRVLGQSGTDCVFGSRFIDGGFTSNYPWPKLLLNRAANTGIRALFGLRYNDVTNAFKMYRREVVDGIQPLLSHHFNLTVEMPLKAIVRGYRYVVVPNGWRNRDGGESKFKIKEMGSRYVFIVLYCLLEKWLSRGDYLRKKGNAA